MSALQRQTYANETDPLFVTTSGNSVIEGDISAKYITARAGFSLLDNSDPQTQVLSIACATNNPGGDPIFQVGSGGAIRFGRYGSATANSEIQPSASGANTDILTIGGTTNTLRLQLGVQSCGVGSIPVGATNVVINSTAVTPTSKIFLSFYGSPSAGPGKGPSQGNLIVNQALIVNGVSFRVDNTNSDGISTAVANVASTFVWMIVQ